MPGGEKGSGRGDELSFKPNNPKPRVWNSNVLTFLTTISLMGFILGLCLLLLLSKCRSQLVATCILPGRLESEYKKYHPNVTFTGVHGY